ncbi:MAG TPA: ATP-binding protein, partial [Chitinophagaceae bacterium]|nr:ATP-binding protein [Chitinophagaceae bacterium]
RDEIGKELHDNISQILLAAKLYLSHAIKKEELHSDLLQSCLENITLAIEETRKLSHTLVAPSLGNITLIQAIEGLLREISVITSIQGKLITRDYNEDALEKNIKLIFYRIVQEQINNILKHSGASSIIIQIIMTSNHILLSITDNGHGFDTNKKTEGIGLRNIRHRAEYYDGSIQIISAPGKGCTLEVNIPI